MHEEKNTIEKEIKEVAPVKEKKQEKPEAVEEKPVTAKPKTKQIQALSNTYMPDGTFVRAGDMIEVSVDYVERLRREKSNVFKIGKY